MGLDRYSKRNLDQVKSDYQVVDEIEQMNLDPDLKVKLRKAKMNMEMEKARLERQSAYEQIADEVNSTPIRSMDSMSVSDINLNNLNSNKSTQQEKSIISFRQNIVKKKNNKQEKIFKKI